MSHNPFAQYATPAATEIAELASERARTYALDMIANRDLSTLSPKYLARIEQIAAGEGAPLTRAGASALIDTLKVLPRKPRTPDFVIAEEFANVPAGSYALLNAEGSANDIGFYEVDRPTSGKWAGHVFVSLQVSDDRVRLSRTAQRAVLERIAADPAAASRLYGQRIERCGVCHRSLTNLESRTYGIGPDCRQKLGW